MATHAQSRHFAKGTLAALDRNAERETTFVQIDHAAGVPKHSLLKSVKHGLAVSGVVNPQYTTVSLPEGMTDLQEALTASKRERDFYRMQYEDAQRQLMELKQAGQRDDMRGWITLTQAALDLGVDYSTIWRAHEKGRLKTKQIGGGRKKGQWMCDPTTYRPAARGRPKKTQ
jgi:hypothetical protein